MTSLIQLSRGEIKVDADFDRRWNETALIVKEHPLWNDPFAQALKNPEQEPQLSYALVKHWTEQMYHGSLAFPRYVGNLVARVENHAAGRMLAINSAVERGYPDENRSHFLLAVDLLRAMGLTDEEIIIIPKAQYSADYIDGHIKYTKEEPLAKGIGCLGLGIEALTTHEFTMIGNAFLRTAKVATKMPVDKIYQSQGYFGENILADAQHETEFEKIAYLAWKSGELPKDLETTMKQIEDGARFSLDLRRKFFDGIYDDVACKKN